LAVARRESKPARWRVRDARLVEAVTAEQEATLRAAAGMCPVHTALRLDIPVTMEFGSENNRRNAMATLIQILGTGCPKCKTPTANAEAAVKALGVVATVEKVEKLAEIMKFGVMMTPALVVDGQDKSAGKVLSAEDIREMLETGN